MAIPDYQSLMLPVLEAASHGEVRISDVIQHLADRFELTEEERTELLPSGRQPTFSNRVHWARTYLVKAGLLEATRRAHVVITERGRHVLESLPKKIDIHFLSQFPEFNEFRRKTDDADQRSDTEPVEHSQAVATPDESIRKTLKAINVTLRQELLELVAKGTPQFFEQLMVDLLLAMGFGGSTEEAGRAIGRSGDDGVDGVIDQDPLGLDRVYIQAKRYEPGNTVGPSAIRDFFGSLDMHKATKGLFVTTSNFTKQARETANRLGKRIVLVDGEQLTALMIKHNVGCRIEETLHIKKVDEDYFEPN